MFARQVVLLVVAGLGLFAVPLTAFLLLLGLAGPEGAQNSRVWAELALVTCGAVIVWEVIELRLARRGTTAGIVRMTLALVATVLTAVVYLLVRLALF